MTQRSKDAFVGVVAWLYVAALFACTPSEVAGTQLLVRVEAAPTVAAKLKQVRAFWYPVGTTDESAPAGALPFPVPLSVSDGGTNVTLLGSFGIAQGQQERLRLVIQGYESSDPSAPPVIEQKAIVGFVRDQKATVTMSLMDACYQRANECSGLSRTCYPVAAAAVASGACGPVTERAAVVEPERNDPPQPVDDGGVPDEAPIAERVMVTAISPSGHDRFLGVTHDNAGNIYAIGQTSAGIAATDDTQVVLAKFKPDGALDPSFGTGGFVVTNIAVGGQNMETARGIVIQRDGTPSAKIVVVGEADHAPTPFGTDAGLLVRDTDIVLARFSMDGRLDSTFGTGGVARLDLGTGVELATNLPDGGILTSLAGADSAWSLAQTTDGKLVVHGASRAVGLAADGGIRSDSDYTLLRLTADGALDPSFGTGGIVRTDIGQVNGAARSGIALGDGSIVGTGYTTSTVLGQSTQQPVLYKVDAAGRPDPTFGTSDAVATPGVWHDFARPDRQRVEPYGAALQDTRIVTVGYGPTPSSSATGTDWFFLRFNGDGTQDRSFGTGGVTALDVAGFSDNARAITVLPDRRIMGVGGGRPAQPMASAPGVQPANVDGMVAVLTPNGQPDATFGSGGIRLFSWGEGDHLHACAVAPNKKQVAIVGAAGSGAAATGDDDAVLVLLPLP